MPTLPRVSYVRDLSTEGFNTYIGVQNKQLIMVETTYG